MFCPICKSFVCSKDERCKICGKILKIKKTKKKSKNSKSKSNNSNSKKKNKDKKRKIAAKIRRNKNLGGKTRQYNDRKNFEFSVLGCYNIW